LGRNRKERERARTRGQRKEPGDTPARKRRPGRGRERKGKRKWGQEPTKGVYNMFREKGGEQSEDAANGDPAGAPEGKERKREAKGPGETGKRK